MKIKFNKNTFLKFIFINLIIINIKSKYIDANKFDPQYDFFTCPPVNSITQIENYLNCNELRLLILLYHKYTAENRFDTSEERNIIYLHLLEILRTIKNPAFKEYINNTTDEKTKRFFTEKFFTAGEEIKEKINEKDKK